MLKNNHTFGVDFGPENASEKDKNKVLFCKCGHIQKVKTIINRSLTKTSENNNFISSIEPKCFLCENCQTTYEFFSKSLFWLKQNSVVEIENIFDFKKIHLLKTDFYVLEKSKKFFYYNSKYEKIDSFVIKDFIIFDTITKSVKYFLNPVKFDFTSKLENESITNIGLENIIDTFIKEGTSNTNYFEQNLRKTKIYEAFFKYNSELIYGGLSKAFGFLDTIMTYTLDYQYLSNIDFFKNFKISSKIFSEFNKNNKKVYYVLFPNLFGGDKLIKKPLVCGDYLNNLNIFSKIIMLFLTYPELSSVAKTKGMQFLIDIFDELMLCSSDVLKKHKITNPIKILEISASYSDSLKDIIKHNSKNKNEPSPEFKFKENSFNLTPLIFKKLKSPKELAIIFNINKKNFFIKEEFESLFLKYDYENIIEVFTGLQNYVSNYQLTFKHIEHILKYNLFKIDRWLELYSDSIKSLNLIVDYLIELKKENKENKENKIEDFEKISKISRNKIFEIKTTDKLKRVHNELASTYRSMADEAQNASFQKVTSEFKWLDQTINYFDFKVIPDLKELSQEGLIMKHCVYSYLKDVAEKKYLVLRVFDTISGERATLGIKLQENQNAPNGIDLFFQQLKGYDNSRTTHLLIQTAKKFMEKNKITIESGFTYGTDLVSNEALEKRMKDYLTKKEATKLRSLKK